MLVGKIVLVNPEPSVVDRSSWVSVACLMLTLEGCLLLVLDVTLSTCSRGFRPVVSLAEDRVVFLELEVPLKLLEGRIEESVGLAWSSVRLINNKANKIPATESRPRRLWTNKNKTTRDIRGHFLEQRKTKQTNKKLGISLTEGLFSTPQKCIVIDVFKNSYDYLSLLLTHFTWNVQEVLRYIKAWVCHFFAPKYKGVVYLQNKLCGKGETWSLHYPCKLVFMRLTSPW